ncbi:MAG: ATP synthase A1 subunit C [Candidatus Hydrothermarchaeota archaeon]
MNLGGIGSLAEKVGFGNYPEIFLGLIIVAALIVFIGIITPILRLVIDISPYAYSNARVRGMETRLLSASKYNEIMESASFQETLSNLEGTEYGQYVAQVVAEGKGSEYADKMLDQCLCDSYEAVVRFAPENVKKIFATWKKRWEIKNLKKILRSIHAGIYPDMDTIFAIGDVGMSTYESLADSKSIEEFVSKLEGTEYGEVLSEHLSAYQESRSLLLLESALDKYYYSLLWKSVFIVSDENTRPLALFFGSEIDITNIKLLLRAKAENLLPEEIKKLLIPNGHDLHQYFLDSLSEAESVVTLINSLEGTKYGKILMDELVSYEEDGSLTPLERALDKSLVALGKDLSKRQPFGISPLLTYLMLRENDINNLKIVLRCKEEMFPVEKIRKHMLWV